MELADLDADPIVEFARWLDAAIAAGLPEPTAMFLGTADARGAPSSRTVLLKAYDQRGFVFYTNLRSRKGRELAENPRAAATFLWRPIDRQVSVTGRVSRVADDEAAAYFATRPRGSQLGAWVSRQSEVIASRAVLDERLAELEERFRGRNIPLPDFWGGFRIAPETIEFWHARPDRLHDRVRYRRDAGDWVRERLSP